MPRLLTLNAAKVTQYAVTPDGKSMTATYQVGATDGATFTVLPGSNVLSSASYLMADADTKAMVLQSLLLLIFQQEGLTVGADALFGPDGMRIL